MRAIFNVVLIVRDKPLDCVHVDDDDVGLNVLRCSVHTNHNLSEEKGEPKAESSLGSSAYQRNALPLGQTGSPVTRVSFVKYRVNSLPHHVAAWLWEVTPANNLRRLFGETDG